MSVMVSCRLLTGRQKPLHLPTKCSCTYLQKCFALFCKTCLQKTKQYVTVLDFIGNDYKRSVQIAFALGGLAKNFVVEKKLIASLVKEDFKSIGLVSYGVIIHLDELSKKEVLSFIDQVNFNTKSYLEQDYKNFKKYISAADYPRHVDYLNNDYAPDLIKFMQSKIGGRKNASYYGFLKAIGEENLPAFDERQEAFVKYVSEMLPIVRPYEYLIIQKIVDGVGKTELENIRAFVQISMANFQEPAFEHAIHYMVKSGFFDLREENEKLTMLLSKVTLNTELDEYREIFSSLVSESTMQSLLSWRKMVTKLSIYGQNTVRSRYSSFCLTIRRTL